VLYFEFLLVIEARFDPLDKVQLLNDEAYFRSAEEFGDDFWCPHGVCRSHLLNCFGDGFSGTGCRTAFEESAGTPRTRFKKAVQRFLN